MQKCNIRDLTSAVAPDSSMHSKHVLTLVFLVLVGGCGEDRDRGSPAALSEAALAGVYSGVFPCEDCPGIAATLWLRADGRFFFRQRYLADQEFEAVDAYSLGRWTAAGDRQAIELSGQGPIRTFTHPDEDTLLMQTESDLEHRLTRDPGARDFSDRIRMTGMVRLRGDRASFTECHTGLVAPVSKGGDFARFRHQYRSAGRRNEPVYVELEGRYSWSGDGPPQSLTIERFVTIREDAAC